MASPAQIIRHKFLNTFFSRHSLWFLCILLHSVLHGLEPSILRIVSIISFQIRYLTVYGLSLVL